MFSYILTMAPKVCVNKLKKEMRAFLAEPPPHVPAVYVNEKNMLGAYMYVF